MNKLRLSYTTALLLALPAVHSNIFAAEKFIWSEGHGDLGVYYNNGWQWYAEEDRKVEDVIINLRDNARTAIPASPSFAFLGTAGDPIWIIPSGQQPGIPFMGANHQLTPPGTFTNGRFDLRLSSVDGPGGFIMWTVGGGGQPTVLMNSRDGITAADKANAPAPGHWHQNWGFTSPGTYRVGYRAEGTLSAGGQTVTSAEAVYTFEIGVIKTGEADVEVAYENGELELHIHDETTDTEFNPAHLALQAGPATWQTVPGDPAFGFLGSSGSGIQVFPQDETEGVLFLGLAAAEVPMGAFANDTVNLQLISLTGPGDFFYYETDAFGSPTVFFNTADGITATDKVAVIAGAHAHRSWAFSAPGVYRVTLQTSGELAGGGTVTSEPATFLFEVFAPTFFNRGEIDLEIAFEDGAFELGLLDEAAEKEYCAAEVVLGVRASATATVPNDPAYGFLGNPGAIIHVLPQEETEGLLFLGIAADEIAPGQFTGGSVNLQLATLDGPGRLALYEIDGFGAPTGFWNSADGLNSSDVFPVAVGSHSHVNWAFTAPGVYHVGLKATGTLLAGNQAVESEVIEFTFAVEAGGTVLTASLINGGAQFQIGWNSETDVSYQLQSRTTFSVPGPGWMNEGNAIIGSGGAQSVTVPKTADTLKVFHLIELP